MALNSGSMVLQLLFLLLCISQLCRCMSSKEFFKEVPKEFRCSGCELTVKVLDRMLGISEEKNAHHLVDLALKSVCEEKRFSISEYKVDYMLKTCEYMTADAHIKELRNILIRHYSRTKKSTYIEVSQQICLNTLRLCPGAAHSAPKADSKARAPKMAQGGSYTKPKQDAKDVPYNDISLDHFKHFMKVSGNDAKIAKPVPESAAHDEL